MLTFFKAPETDTKTANRAKMEHFLQHAQMYAQIAREEKNEELSKHAAEISRLLYSHVANSFIDATLKQGAHTMTIEPKNKLPASVVAFFASKERQVLPPEDYNPTAIVQGQVPLNRAW